MLTPLQIRMAKAGLGWSNSDLAELTGLHKNTINKAENGTARPATLALLKATFEQGNDTHFASFIAKNGGGPGIRINEKELE